MNGRCPPCPTARPVGVFNANVRIHLLGDSVTVPGLARGGLTMQLDALRTVQILLALAGFALGNQLIIDPLAAPRVTISFKVKPFWMEHMMRWMTRLLKLVPIP
ncbi:unnamed protein product [Boreogadus saida]